MVLPELITWLAGDGLGLTAATNLFHTFMPPSPDFVVCLYEYPGFPNDPDLGTALIRREYPGINVAARGIRGDVVAPRLILQQIVSSFAKIGDTTLSGVRYGEVTAKQAPFFLRRDENERVIFTVNFHVTKDFSVS